MSGGIDERSIIQLRDVVDAFGVGTSVAGAPPIDFSLDIVEKEGEPVAKRGKRGGMKQVYRNDRFEDTITLFHQTADGKPLLEKYIEGGRIIRESDHKSARKNVLDQMEKIRKLDLEERFLNGIY